MKITKFFKTGITHVIILAVAFMLLLTLGFNGGFDMKGGSIISINCQSYTQDEASSKVRKVVGSFDNAKVYSIQYGKLYDDKTITVKIQFTEDADETTAEIVDKLFADAFGYDKNDIVESTYITATSDVGGAFTSAVMTKALIASVVALVASGIYLFFRQGLANAMSLLAGVILDVVVLLSVILIFRIEISSYAGIAILAMSLISMILHLQMLTKLNQNAYDEDNRKLSNFKLANLTAEQNLKTTIVIAGIIAVTCLLLAIITPSAVSGLMFALALSTAISATTALYIVPNLWAIGFRHKKKQPKKSVIEVEEE